jgi:hypothetical protein
LIGTAESFLGQQGGVGRSLVERRRAAERVSIWRLRVEMLTQYVGAQAVFGSRRGLVAGAAGLPLWVSCQLGWTLTPGWTSRKPPSQR